MKPEKIPTRTSKFKPLKRIQVNHGPEMKRLLVSVYFGSTDDFNLPRHSIKEVAQLIRMPYSTASFILRQFAVSGNDLNSFKVQLRPRFKMLAESTKKLLLDPNILQLWSWYSITERVKLIEDRHRTKISKNRLTLFYRVKGVRYRQLKRIYREALVQKPTLVVQRAALPWNTPKQSWLGVS